MEKPLLLREPKLFFGGNNPSLDPKVGLLNFGPNGHLGTGEVHELILRIGVIGTVNSIYKLKHFLGFLSSVIEGKEYKESRIRSIDFPGINRRSPLKFELKIDHSRIEEIPQSDIQALEKMPNFKERIIQAVEIYQQKFNDLADSAQAVDIVLLPLSEQLIRLCRNPDYKHDKIIFERRSLNPNEDYSSVPFFDFHNVLKVMGMKYGIKTQIILPRTMNFKRGTQDKASIAWNFAVGLYYKGTGVPWKLGDLEEDTIYVGISFYEEVAAEYQEMRSAMAQVYLKTGESQVIRSKPFFWDKRQGRSPVLSENQAKELANDIISLFKRQKKKNPQRIVIHKTSPFTDSEIEGFNRASENIEIRDYIHILSKGPVRFFPTGSYTQVRGTFYGKKDTYLLYTSGFIPALNTYPGSRIAEPLLLNFYNVDSTPIQIANDILALSKLDWNSADFCKREPVTILVSKKVGKILSEIRDKSIKPPIGYYYYM